VENQKKEAEDYLRLKREHVRTQSRLAVDFVDSRHFSIRINLSPVLVEICSLVPAIPTLTRLLFRTRMLMHRLLLYCDARRGWAAYQVECTKVREAAS
jgi:hypothetical protein